MRSRAAFVWLMYATGSATAGPLDPPQSAADTYNALATETDEALTAHQLPQIPATFAIGLETTAVQRPGTMADFGAALVNSFNDDSSLKTGVAIEVAPFRIWKTNQFTAEQWVGGEVGYGWELLDSVALSMATADGGTDAAGIKNPPLSSVALRADLYNSTDLRKSSDYYGCVRQAMEPIALAAANGPPAPGEDPQRVAIPLSVRKAAQKKIADCQKERSGVVIELAGALVSSGDPIMGSSTFNGFRAWATAGLAFGSVDLTMEGDVLQHDEDHVRRDYFAGGRVDVTSSTSNRFSLGLEAYYASTAPADSASRLRRLGLGASVDLKLSSGIVLSAGAQGRTDVSEEFSLVVLTKLAFVLGGKSTDLYTSYNQIMPR